MARECHLQDCQSRYYAKITAGPINYRSPATSTTDAGTTMYPAARLMRPSWRGGCRGTDKAREASLYQNATPHREFLRFGTR